MDRLEAKLTEQIQQREAQRATMLQNAETFKDLREKRRLWRCAAELEDAIGKLKRQVIRHREKRAASTAPTLFGKHACK